MDSVRATITQLVPEIPDDQLDALVTHLVEEGYSTAKDLLYLEEQDLKPFLKTLHIRKLLHLIKSGSQLQTENCALPSTSAASTPTNPAAATAHRASQERASKDRWASSFEVDWGAMPADLVRICQEEKVPEPYLRRKMVKLLGEAIAVHDPKPKIKEVSKIASLVVARYPHSFADVMSTGNIIGDGTSSLTRQLAVYMDNRRRPHNAAKRGPGRTEDDEPEATLSKQGRQTDSHGCVAWEPDCAPYTWDDLEVMRQQLCKATNLEEISSTMKKTYALQRRHINSMQQTLLEIAESWPHLFKEPHFFVHVDTLLGFSYHTAFTTELTSKGNQLFDVMWRAWKPQSRSLLQTIQKTLDCNGQAPPRYTFVLQLLTTYFDENPEALISFHPVSLVILFHELV